MRYATNTLETGRDLAVRALRIANRALEDEVAQRQSIVEALRESELRHRQVLDSLPDMVAVCRHGQVVFVNSTGARLAGFASTDEMEGMRLGDLIESLSDSSSQTSTKMLTLYVSETPYSRGLLRRADGTAIEIEYSSTRPYTDDEDAVQFIVRDVSQRIRSEEAMRRMAFHDALTDLPNRALYMDRLSCAIAQARRDDEYLAVVFVDLDGFKQINDGLGHDAGDAVLVEVANRLSEQLRDEDTIARFGGDEFTIVARLAAPSDARALADRLLSALRPTMEFSGTHVTLRASVGVAVYPYDGVEEAELLRRADAAMYAAKAGGGSAYQVCTGPVLARLDSRHFDPRPFEGAMTERSLHAI